MSKRRQSDSSDSSDSSDDDIVGPSLTPKVPGKVSTVPEPSSKGPQKKIKKVIKINTQDYDQFNEFYKYSYKNESKLTALTKTPDDAVIISGFKNGTIKFWKKIEGKPETASSTINKDEEKEELEEYGQLKCVKQFSAHPNKEVRQLLVSSNGLKLYSIAQGDSSIKVFDIKSLDMIQVLSLGFIPNTLGPSSNCLFEINGEEKLLISEHDTNRVVTVSENEEIEPIKSVHKNQIFSISYNRKYKSLVSCDVRGILEYWSPMTSEPPTGLDFQYKSQTDLFDLAKSKSKTPCINFSADHESFVTYSYPDNILRVFKFTTGKLAKKIDESYKVYPDQVGLINQDKTIYNNDPDAYINSRNILFDNNDQVLIYPSLKGIKILNLQSMKVIKIIGNLDQESSNLRFSQVMLLNKVNINKFDLSMLSSNNSIIESQLVRKPLIISTSLISPRLFVFGSHKEQSERDFDLTSGKTTSKKVPKIEFSKVTLHTTVGDITIKLFGKLTPKTVENFIGLCKKKYYNNVIFHRVIEHFMIQTGDPKGDGTGGESIWGGHFKDEFNHLLNHSKPFMVSMANAGPNTNGSQFFITTEPATFLDKKHTVFGEVIGGTETVKNIEVVETDGDDRPLEQVAILSTSLGHI